MSRLPKIPQSYEEIKEKINEIVARFKTALANKDRGTSLSLLEEFHQYYAMARVILQKDYPDKLEGITDTYENTVQFEKLLKLFFDKMEDFTRFATQVKNEIEEDVSRPNTLLAAGFSGRCPRCGGPLALSGTYYRCIECNTLHDMMYDAKKNKNGKMIK